MEVGGPKLIRTAFRIICVFATIVMVGYWGYKYSLDTDTISMNYKQYFHTSQDTFPVLSMCFSDPFLKDKLEQSHSDINISTYKKFLLGEIDEPKLTTIDYDNVTVNLKDYIRRYIIIWKNGSRLEYPVDDTFGWKIPYVSYNGIWYDDVIIKCFALEITDKNVLALNVEVNHTIFSNSLRPKIGKFFAFFQRVLAVD